MYINLEIRLSIQIKVIIKVHTLKDNLHLSGDMIN